MTIAACYLSTEGVILGADSTSTSTFILGNDTSIHHLEYAQKIFEIGERGTLGLACWGLGAIGEKSYRTLSAELGDAMTSKDSYTVSQAAEWWRDKFWDLYELTFAAQIVRAKELKSRGEIIETKKLAGSLTPAETAEFQAMSIEIQGLHSLGGGFCIGGRDSTDRQPRAYQITYNPFQDRSVSITHLSMGWCFWGCPDIVQRIIFGIETTVRNQILASGKWAGTADELDVILTTIDLEPYTLLPLREAVDWVHAMIYSTLKAYKFSSRPSVCGGPIDIALISSDRPFRWIRHKSLGAAIIRSDHESLEGSNGHFRS